METTDHFKETIKQYLDQRAAKDVEERPAITKIIQKNIDTIKATLQQVA